MQNLPGSGGSSIAANNTSPAPVNIGSGCRSAEVPGIHLYGQSMFQKGLLAILAGAVGSCVLRTPLGPVQPSVSASRRPSNKETPNSLRRIAKRSARPWQHFPSTLEPKPISEMPADSIASDL